MLCLVVTTTVSLSPLTAHLPLLLLSLSLPDSLKTELERLEEEAMIAELVELVEKRDELLWALHMEKTL